MLRWMNIMNSLKFRKLIARTRSFLLDIKYGLLRRILSRERIFSSIHADNFWASAESTSGVGSELMYTSSLRSVLPGIISSYQVKTICDAPCGDFNWMQNVLSEAKSVNYTGIDIVQALIQKNKLLFKTDSIDFILKDICTESLPKCDLLIVRDVLFHFSNSDLVLFYKNLSKTEFKYLLVSHHDHAEDVNKDILTGDFRELNIGLAPLNFPIDKALVAIDDSPEWYLIKRKMLLFCRRDLFEK